MGHTAREMQAGTTERERGNFLKGSHLCLRQTVSLEAAALVALKQDSYFQQQICIESSGCQARGNHLRAKQARLLPSGNSHSNGEENIVVLEKTL